MNIVKKAIKFARNKHGDVKDDCGKNYFEAHVLPVYKILRVVAKDDKNLLCAAILHDTIEDTNTGWCELSTEFGDDVANLVFEVTHEGEKDTGYYFPRLQSRRAILLKFADRLSNLSRMESWSTKRQEQYLRKSKFWKTTWRDVCGMK